jgi:hypothetical protein
MPLFYYCPTQRYYTGKNEELLKRYLNSYFVEKGMIADYAIHDIGSGNPHAHVMLTMRKVNKNGF